MAIFFFSLTFQSDKALFKVESTKKNDQFLSKTYKVKINCEIH